MLFFMPTFGILLRAQLFSLKKEVRVLKLDVWEGVGEKAERKSLFSVKITFIQTKKKPQRGCFDFYGEESSQHLPGLHPRLFLQFIQTLTLTLTLALVTFQSYI